MVDDKKAKAKKMITPAEAKTDNRSVSEKTGKVFTGHKGPRRSVGPAGAPVSIKTGKVFTGKEVGISDLPSSCQITMQGNKKSQNRIT